MRTREGMAIARFRGRLKSPTAPAGRAGPNPCHRRVLHHPLQLWESREEAERVAESWNTGHVAQSGVRRPRRRGDLVDALEWLADHQPGGHCLRIGRLSHGLFGDPPDTISAIGGILRDHHEADLINAVLAPLHTIMDDLGPPKRDTDYTGHPHWPDVVAAAHRARTTLSQPT